MQCVYVVRDKKTHNFPHTVHYCCFSMLRLSEMHRFLQSSSFWETRCALIGQLSEYLKCVTEMLRHSPCCHAVSWRDETKIIKPIINEAFVAFSEDIITDYNDSYGRFTHCAAAHKHYTISAFVIVETPNNHCSTLLKTCVWIVNSSKFFKYWNVLTFKSEAPDSLRSWNCPTLHSHSLCSHCRLLSPRIRK